jgi:hypothetical protein
MNFSEWFISSPYGTWLSTSWAKTEILAEKWQYVILKPIRNGTGVSSLVDLKAVLDAICVQNIMQLAGVSL